MRLGTLILLRGIPGSGKTETRRISLIVESRHGNSSAHDVPDETLDKMRNRHVVKI
jgi:tRNA uridine 5-carbamoylmethylation protein Kti12